MDTLPTVLLKPGTPPSAIIAGHPWIYAGSFLRLLRSG